MPFEARVFRVMVGSPSDVINDRKAVVEVVHEWNGVNAAEKEAILLPVLWEIDAPPLAGQPPQQTIREELVQDSDMLISLFWTRLGSPTENAESGTAEEIEEFVKAGKPVLVYLSNRQYSPQAIDPEQLERLRKFMDRNRERLLIRRYDTIEELKELLRRHLPATVRRLPGLQRSIDDVGIHPEGTHAAADSVQQRFHAARVEWDAERDSEPLGIASGKRVLESLERVLIQAAQVPDFDFESVQDLLTETKRLGRYTLVMDGGKSFTEFWKQGDDVFQRAARLLDPLQRPGQ